MSPLVKNIATAVIGCAALFLGWWLIGEVRSGDQDGAVRYQAAAQTREFRTILNNLNGINLDSSLLLDKNFTELEDYSQEIVSRPVGRENPFVSFD